MLSKAGLVEPSGWGATTMEEGVSKLGLGEIALKESLDPERTHLIIPIGQISSVEPTNSEKRTTSTFESYIAGIIMGEPFSSSDLRMALGLPPSTITAKLKAYEGQGIIQLAPGAKRGKYQKIK